MYNTDIDETIINKKLHNGLNCYIIPKNTYSEKRAVMSIKCGSVDCLIKTPTGVLDIPSGTAHFLEHKLFDNKTGNAFDSFSKMGAYVNAYTSFNSTAYYFSCADKYFDNLKILLEFIAEPYFTEQTVSKEMGIIEQEISMYNDNPGWVVYAGMLEALYESHPARLSISGTKQSINNITKDVLYKYYDSFYVPSNMHLVCSGDIDVEGVINLLSGYFTNLGKKAYTVLPREREDVYKAEIKSAMKISRPIFLIGIKDRVFENQMKRAAVFKIMLDLFIGEGSKLREVLLNNNLADSRVTFDYVYGDKYGYASILGESPSPFKLFEEFLQEAERLKKYGFDASDFKRIKSKHMGRFIRGFNSIEAIVAGASELAVKGGTLFDFYECYKSVALNDVNNLIRESFRNGGYCISVLEPLPV